MAFFSFSLLENSITYRSTKIEPNQKYYSKDITLWKELNNRNKKKQVSIISYENRLKVNTLDKKILFCFPPRFGLGDAVEYGIAINSIIESSKFDKIGIAFCSNYYFIFKNVFKFSNIYTFLISDSEIKKYDTVFHITLEIEALKFQKYNRSNISQEICNYFNVKMLKFKINSNQKINKQKKNIIYFSCIYISYKKFTF